MIEGPRAARADELDAVVRLATSVFCREGEPDMRATGAAGVEIETMAALVFGSVEHEPPATKDPTLRGILARLFPLPLPGHGLSYTYDVRGSRKTSHTTMNAVAARQRYANKSPAIE